MEDNKIMGQKSENKSSFMDGAIVIQRVYEKDGIIHIEAYQSRVIRSFTQRMIIAKTGATFTNG